MNQTATKNRSEFISEYSGLEWLGGNLPTECITWPIPKKAARIYEPHDEYAVSAKQVKRYTRQKPWIFPSRPHLFFSDMHADADAFLRSLVASGGVKKTGSDDNDFALTPLGEQASFIIGGDCFDKGPDNLRLFRVLARLRELGPDLHILVGNHDLRTYIGLACAGRKDPRHAHLFVRMGKKTAPLFKEIYETYLAGGNHSHKHKLSEDEVRAQLFPDEDWYEQFPEAVAGMLSEEQIAKELRRIREKVSEFEFRSKKIGMSLAMVYATLNKARELFLDKDGEFGWYFDEMALCHRAGSFLMLHAGVDDVAAEIIRQRGVEGLNADYKRALEDDLFDLYNGPLGNTFRTKYRETDLPFTEKGLTDINIAGLYAIIHGHRSLLYGQQITLRNGLLNFECDASVDCNTRDLEDLPGLGGAVTIVRPDARILGISTDYPLAKMFDLTRVSELTTVI
ncbi:MAG: metallophosphoesterase [Gammaproteobacteria bacterium]|nr:metallophosphoesterase [Gammaproteobacteria bacterium]